MILLTLVTLCSFIIVTDYLAYVNHGESQRPSACRNPQAGKTYFFVVGTEK